MSFYKERPKSFYKLEDSDRHAFMKRIFEINVSQLAEDVAVGAAALKLIDKARKSSSVELVEFAGTFTAYKEPTPDQIKRALDLAQKSWDLETELINNVLEGYPIPENDAWKVRYVADVRGIDDIGEVITLEV